MTATTDQENKRRVRSVRMWDDTWDLMENRARGAIVAPFINGMAEAGLGFARCRTCDALVPVEFDIRPGLPLSHWADVAGRRVSRQHPDHEPVTISSEPSAARPAGLPSLPVFREPAASGTIGP